MNILGLHIDSNSYNHLVYIDFDLENKYMRDIVQLGLRRFEENKRFTHMVWKRKVVRFENCSIFLAYRNYQSRLMESFAGGLNARKES
jgi:hypothetical protein